MIVRVSEVAARPSGSSSVAFSRSQRAQLNVSSFAASDS